MDQCHQFSADIAGSGVRISFYVQTFILVLLVDRSYEDAENSLWTFIATSFGLTIAALVQVKINGLSLLEGILVSQLCWFANIGTFLALASYSRSKGKDNLVKAASVLQGYFSMILTVVMWVFADRLSSTLPCNYKFVFMFGWELPALGSGRKVGLGFASVLLVVYTCVTFTEYWRKYGASHGRPHREEYDLEMGPSTADRRRRPSAGSAQNVRHADNGILSRGRRRPQRHINWLPMEVDPKLLGILLCQAIVLTYFIVTTELIITRNQSQPQGGFGFGQVLALTVVIPSVIALYRAIRRNRAAKLRDTERREAENARANGELLEARTP